LEETRQLARFVAETEYMPEALMDRFKVYLLDNLAAGFLGSVQAWSDTVADAMRELGGREEASIIHRDWRTDVSRATFVNGVMLGAFEAEHIGHIAHPSATVFPAALAMAERLHTDGRSFLQAMLVGYEVVCRVGEAQTRATEVERGFHNPGVNGAFGAAAATGKLLGLDEEQLGWALGIAGSHACGLVEFVHEGAMTKRIHPGRAAQLGLESALLAQGGLTGPTTVLEGRYGYLQAYSPSPRPERLVAGLGQEWLAADLTIKAYPCHNRSQAVVHAIQEWKRSSGVDPRGVRRVCVRVDAPTVEERYLDRRPRTMLGAQYSLPFTTAVALVRDLANPYTLDESVLSDAVISDLAQRVEVQAGSDRAEVVIDEVRMRASDFPGSSAQPLDFAGATDKLRRYAGPLVGDARVAQLVDLVGDLEQLDDVGRLAAAIAS
jgi:2-methylcitrate dehydratase PrpD